MAALIARERTLTHLDHARLSRMLAEHSETKHEAGLRELLCESELVPGPAVGPETITMYSQFVIEDMATGGRRKLALCYPHDADPSAGFVSVLAPLGAALLGLRVGDVAHWHLAGGQAHAVRIAEMLFQPEASHDYTT
jgi:regulator of nucleoside diphosphate kinase